MTEAAPIRVVTDSLAWIPADVAAEHGIRVVPLHVSFGDEHFTETVDLTNREFYRRLREAKTVPKTSQPSPGEFLDAYRDVARGAQAILSIHASSRLSGTFHAAATAAEMLRGEAPGVWVEVLDTLQIATAQGIVAIRAAEAAAAGTPFEQILSDTRELIPKPRILVTVETLEYLQRGGRIGRARAFLGSLLNIKPVLGVEDGEVVPKERVRSRSKVMERIVDLVVEYAQGRPLAHAGILHAEAPESAQELERRLRERVTIERLLTAEIGPVIGTYVGPGAFGVTFHCD
jgi:DegV family protein with EDD domain